MALFFFTAPTVTPTPSTPDPVSEWGDPDGHVDQCSWCALVMLANKAGAGIPATLAQSKVFGEHAAAISDLNAAVFRELGWRGTAYAGTAAGFLKKLQPGWGAVVQGFYSAWPARLQRFDTKFAAKGRLSIHDEYVERTADGRLFIIDPLFHDEPGYRGEWVTAAELSAFMTAYRTGAKALLALEGSHVPQQSGPAQGADMGEFVTPFVKPLPLAIAGNTRSWSATAPYPELDAVTGTQSCDATVYVNQTAVPHGAFLRVVTGTTGRRLVVSGAGTLGSQPVPDCSGPVAAEHERTLTQAKTALEAIP